MKIDARKQLAKGGALAAAPGSKTSRTYWGAGKTAAPHSSRIPPHVRASLCIARCCFREEKLLLSCEQDTVSGGQEIIRGSQHPTALVTAPELGLQWIKLAFEPFSPPFPCPETITGLLNHICQVKYYNNSWHLYQ